MASGIRGWLESAGCKRIKTTGDNNFISTCPFHQDSKPSFSMRGDNGLFVCYSAKCGVTGNAVNFLMSALKMPFSKAKEVAERDANSTFDSWNISQFHGLPTYDQRRDVAENVEVKITEGHLGIYDFCPKYMLERGFSKKVLRKWEVGFDHGTQHVTFPMRDKNQQLVGVTKRTTIPNWDPKYVHLGFKKSRYLYGLGIDRLPTDTLIVSEGQPDAIAIDQAQYLINGEGYTSVSTIGSRISTEQLDVVVDGRWKFIVLAFDNDEDGTSATLKAGRYLAPKLGRGRLLVARRYPRGIKDPAQFLEKDPNKLVQFLRDLEPYENVWPSLLGLGGKYR